MMWKGERAMDLYGGGGMEQGYAAIRDGALDQRRVEHPRGVELGDVRHPAGDFEPAVGAVHWLADGREFGVAHGGGLTGACRGSSAGRGRAGRWRGTRRWRPLRGAR